VGWREDNTNMGRKSEDGKRRRRKDKAREKTRRRGKNTLRGARFKLRILEKTMRAKTGKKMNKNGGADAGAAGGGGGGGAGGGATVMSRWIIGKSRVNKKESKLICKFGI